MWRSLADWTLAFFGMVRELQEHRATIHNLEKRVRDMEEGLKMLGQQQQHRDEVAALERDKLLLTIENEFARRDRSLPAPRGKKSK